MSSPTNAHRSSVKIFTRCAGVIFVLTGIAKLLALLSGATIFLANDPIFGIQFRILLAIVGILELIVGAMCLLSRMQPLSIIAWLSTMFAFYRLGLYLTGWKGPCGCLGNFNDIFHVSPILVDNIMKTLLGILFVGSYFFLIYGWRVAKGNVSLPVEPRAPTAPLIKSFV